MQANICNDGGTGVETLQTRDVGLKGYIDEVNVVMALEIVVLASVLDVGVSG